MSNEIFDKDKENELIGKQKKHLNKKALLIVLLLPTFTPINIGCL